MPLERKMKFGKNLLRVVDLSDPEWGPYFMNYKHMKKLINEIVEENGGAKVSVSSSSNPVILSKSAKEVEFFQSLKEELKKLSDFFATTENLYRIRHTRISDGYERLLETGNKYDKNTWSRLLRAVVKFYKDVLLLENFAIMNYCAFSKILKKHDKLTGFSTRDAFMRNVMSQQNFTNYPYVMDLLKKSEQLYLDIQAMESVMPLEDEERMFVDAIRDLNQEASKLQKAENNWDGTANGSGSDNSDGDTVGKTSNTTTTSECAIAGLACEEGDDEDDKDEKHLSSTSPVRTGDIAHTPLKGLDAATLAVMAAATKSSQVDYTPDLRSVLSWIQAMAGNSTRDGVPSSTDNNNATSQAHKFNLFKMEGNGLESRQGNANQLQHLVQSFPSSLVSSSCESTSLPSLQALSHNSHQQRQHSSHSHQVPSTTPQTQAPFVSALDPSSISSSSSAGACGAGVGVYGYLRSPFVGEVSAYSQQAPIGHSQQLHQLPVPVYSQLPSFPLQYQHQNAFVYPASYNHYLNPPTTVMDSLENVKRRLEQQTHTQDVLETDQQKSKSSRVL